MNGLKSKIYTPPAKFERLPCNARPIVNPAVLSTAINEDAGIPRIPTMIIISIMCNANFTIDCTNLATVGSICVFSKDFFINFNIHFTIFLPTKRTNIAIKRFFPKEALGSYLP